jgi:hypothetical protein
MDLTPKYAGGLAQDVKTLAVQHRQRSDSLRRPLRPETCSMPVIAFALFLNGCVPESAYRGTTLDVEA